MQLLSVDRSNGAGVQTAAVTVLTVTAVVLCALVMAYWTWQWLGPRPESPAQPAASASGHLVSANELFGKPEPASGGTAPTGGSFRLLATVAAAAGRHGYAVIRMEPKETLTVREGDEMVPGIKLAEVATDHVILERGGIRETLSWPSRNADVAAPVPLIRK